MPPDAPNFIWEYLPSENEHAIIKIYWIPYFHNQRAGSYFYAKYREKGQAEWLKTENEIQNDYVIVLHLDPAKTYEFIVVSVDGEFETESRPQDVYTDIYSVKLEFRNDRVNINVPPGRVKQEGSFLLHPSDMNELSLHSFIVLLAITIIIIIVLMACLQ